MRYYYIMTLTLHDALKTSYKDKKNQQLDMSKFGYTRDEDLSNHNHQVYHHAGENKTLFSVTGSHNKHNAGVDAYIGLSLSGPQPAQLLRVFYNLDSQPPYRQGTTYNLAHKYLLVS